MYKLFTVYKGVEASSKNSYITLESALWNARNNASRLTGFEWRIVRLTDGVVLAQSK